MSYQLVERQPGNRAVEGEVFTDNERSIPLEELWRQELKTAREQRGWTLEMARDATERAISLTYISSLEGGVRPPPRILTLPIERYIEALGQQERLMVATMLLMDIGETSRWSSQEYQEKQAILRVARLAGLNFKTLLSIYKKVQDDDLRAKILKDLVRDVTERHLE